MTASQGMPRWFQHKAGIGQSRVSNGSSDTRNGFIKGKEGIPESLRDEEPRPRRLGVSEYLAHIGNGRGGVDAVAALDLKSVV